MPSLSFIDIYGLMVSTQYPCLNFKLLTSLPTLKSMSIIVRSPCHSQSILLLLVSFQTESNSMLVLSTVAAYQLAVVAS